ncbi:MAG: DNA polymerase III subunit chi [Deltaproteobacteria bacterium]|nr:DNA polymerase III subunit chi [Deltaproteobacteria bacterium]
MAGPLIFFVETPAAEQRILLCRWVEGFYAQKRRIQVVVESTVAAQQLDAMLWTFSQESFIPHGIQGGSNGDALPNEVWITIGETLVKGCEVLIADCPVELDFMKHFRWSVHFIVMDDSRQRQESRLVWQRAKEAGFALTHVPHASTFSIPTLKP